MMTKKDYIRAATLVRECRQVDGETTAITLEDFCVEFFRGDNPRFDSDRFRDACQANNHNSARKR